MKSNTTIIFVLVLTSFFLSEGAGASKLCSTPVEQHEVAKALSESAQKRPGQIAKDLNITEAAVVHALPVESRVPVQVEEFESLWSKLTQWDDALLIAFSAGSVFEMFGPLPRGQFLRGYLDLDKNGNAYGGHVKVDNLSAIYLLSTEGENGAVHQVAFFDREGRRVFGVYVPRNKDQSLKSQPHSQFLRLKQDYGEIARRLLLTDLSCMWKAPADEPIRQRNND